MPEPLPSQFVAGIMSRYRKGKIQVLVQDAEDLRTGDVLTEFPGGMSEIQDNGNPEKTLRSEYEEETGYKIREEAEPRQIYESVDLRGNGTKRYYHFRKRDCMGNRRTRIVIDGNHRLHLPRWEDLDKVEADPKFRHSHRKVIPFLRHVISRGPRVS